MGWPATALGWAGKAAAGAAGLRFYRNKAAAGVSRREFGGFGTGELGITQPIDCATPASA